MSWFVLAIAVLACSVLSQAQPCQDIRNVDFRNMTVHTMASDENELRTFFNAPRTGYGFEFKNGVADEFIDLAQKKAGTPEGRATIAEDSVVDVPGGPTIRFLNIVWEHLQGPGAFAVLLGFACQDGRAKEVFQFSADGAQEFEVGPGDQLIVKQAIWRKNDAHCCPSQTRTLYYGWDIDGQAFRRLRVDWPNPLPESH
jgi:hypothetical protein